MNSSFIDSVSLLSVDKFPVSWLDSNSFLNTFLEMGIVMDKIGLLRCPLKRYSRRFQYNPLYKTVAVKNKSYGSWNGILWALRKPLCSTNTERIRNEHYCMSVYVDARTGENETNVVFIFIPIVTKIRACWSPRGWRFGGRGYWVLNNCPRSVPLPRYAGSKQSEFQHQVKWSFQENRASILPPPIHPKHSHTYTDRHTCTSMNTHTHP